MYNIIATFNNLINLKKVMKVLRKDPMVKGHILVIHKDLATPENETYISSVLMKRSKEVSSLKLDDTKKGILFGSIIGSLSSLIAVLFNTSLLHLSTITVLAAIAIIFYGGAVGSIIGLLISNMVRKYDETNFSGEMTLIIKDVEEETKETVISTLKEFEPVKLKIY